MVAGKRPTKRDAQAAVAARLGNYQAKVPKRTALVGHSDGSTIDVTGKPDYVYARIRGDDRAQVEVLNYHGALAYNMPVKMELVALDSEKKVWAITGVDRSFFVDTGGWGGAGNVGSHRESHEWPDQAPGPDAINVYARAIAPLRGYSIAGAGLRVYVNSAILTAYVGNGVYIYTGGSVLIASGDLPTTAGQIRIILISLDISDPDNPSLTKTLGDPVLALESIEPGEPDFPADEIPVCAVLVRDDHTQLEEIDIYDRRKLVTGNVKLSALTSPDGTLTPLSVDDNGDVTIADGDLIFGTAAQISVTGALQINASGGVVVNEGGADADTRIEGVSNTHLFFVDASTGRVGINESAPEVPLHVTGDGSLLLLEGSTSARFDLIDLDSTSGQRRFAISLNAEQLIISQRQDAGGFTRTFLSMSAANQQMFTDPNIDIGLGRNTGIAAQVDIDQSSTTGAQPVLKLDQADLSEEFIQFASTIGAGNPIDTAALGTYYGKARVSVAGVGFKVVALYNS